MMRSLYSAVSGLKTHQTRMDVIGNNIANVNTEAFKSSRMVFTILYFARHAEHFFKCSSTFIFLYDTSVVYILVKIKYYNYIL